MYKALVKYSRNYDKEDIVSPWNQKIYRMKLGDNVLHDNVKQNVNVKKGIQ